MSIKLIKSLNADHTKLSSLLGEIKKEGSLTKAALTGIAEVKNMLISHLAQEDRDFYPIMKEAAKTNPSIAQTLEVMGLDMNQIAQIVLNQISAWQKGEGKLTFTTDIDNLITVLSDRIKREEHLLYTKYLKLVS